MIFMPRQVDHWQPYVERAGAVRSGDPKSSNSVGYVGYAVQGGLHDAFLQAYTVYKPSCTRRDGEGWETYPVSSI